MPVLPARGGVVSIPSGNHSSKFTIANLRGGHTRVPPRRMHPPEPRRIARTSGTLPPGRTVHHPESLIAAGSRENRYPYPDWPKSRADLLPDLTPHPSHESERSRHGIPRRPDPRITKSVLPITPVAGCLRPDQERPYRSSRRITSSSSGVLTSRMVASSIASIRWTSPGRIVMHWPGSISKSVPFR